jgi:gamma-glutamylcyclotransferase (GGCT)/AIG2-like uncharacterized protein YtfP
MLADRALLVGAARVPGRLHDLGPYPGAVPSDQLDQWIHGEVHRFEDPHLLPPLDEYEGAEFERATVSAEMEDGAGVIQCWIYWYVGGGAGAGRVIVSGDWLKRTACGGPLNPSEQ